MKRWNSYEQWFEQRPQYLKNDPVWQFIAYPKSLWLFDLVWQDCERLKSSKQGSALINQLIRSTDSISANIDEGYGCGIERQEYYYFIRIALGSARETRSRYFKLRYSLPDNVLEHRTQLCTEIIALLTTTLNRRKKVENVG